MASDHILCSHKYVAHSYNPPSALGVDLRSSAASCSHCFTYAGSNPRCSTLLPRHGKNFQKHRTCTIHGFPECFTVKLDGFDLGKPMSIWPLFKSSVGSLIVRYPKSVSEACCISSQWSSSVAEFSGIASSHGQPDAPGFNNTGCSGDLEET